MKIPDMHPSIPSAPESDPERGHTSRTSRLAGTDLNLPQLGISLASATDDALHNQQNFTLFDEGINCPVSAVDTGFVNSQQQHSDIFQSRRGFRNNPTGAITLRRIGLDDIRQAAEGIHSSQIDYAGVIKAFRKLRISPEAGQSTIVLLDGCATLSRPDLNNELHFSVAMEGGLKALQELKCDGEIAAYGFVSDYAEYCQRALLAGDWDLFVLNHRYTLLEQWPLFNLLPECKASNTAIVVGNPFNSGVLRGEPSWNFSPPPDFVKARIENIAHVCALHQLPMEAAALQFPLAHPIVPSILVRAPSVAAQKQMYSWLHHPIPDSFWDDLKLAGVMHEEAPVPQQPPNFKAVG